MELSKEGLDLIKKHEGFRSEPYLCPAGVPTIGYGATFYPDRSRVKMDDPPISKEQAEEMLLEMLKDYEDGAKGCVTAEINQNQFTALVSFAYNLGVAALETSTLLKRVNADPCDPDIRYQFSRWVKAGGKVLPGLVKRRREEADLYFK